MKTEDQAPNNLGNTAPNIEESLKNSLRGQEHRKGLPLRDWDEVNYFKEI